MLITRRKLLRAAGIAAPAIILPESAWAQFNGCPPGFCSPTVGSAPVSPCGYPLPTMLSNIIAIWDSNCLAAITLVSGYALYGVDDATGNGHDMTRFGAQQPTWNALTFNGVTGGTLYTSTDLGALACPNPFPMGTGNTLTAWFVGTAALPYYEAGSRFLSYNAPGQVDYNNAGSWCIIANSSSTTVTLHRNGVSAVSPTVALGSYHRFIFTIRADGEMTSYVDNVAGTPATAGGNWVTAGGMHAGCVAGGPVYGYLHSVMGEWGVCNSYSSAATVAALDSYLSTKWSI